MSLRKQDAYRALDLLEEYYNRLDSTEDKDLKNAIERVIKVFKSRLFQALVDIQEFYESILLDERRNQRAKIAATHQLVEEWEKKPLVYRDQENVTPTMNESSIRAPIVDTNPIISPATTIENNKRKPTPTPFSEITEPANATAHSKATELDTPGILTHYSYDDHWVEHEIDLHRVPNKGLGFSIAGGRDTPCIHQSSAVVVTRISPDGVAGVDQRLKLYDIILYVNNMDFTEIDHQVAVDTLKTAEDPVILIVRRLAPASMETIELDKPPDVQLGFSIAGGITREHVKGDYGIFITNIVPGSIADKNGRLIVGDRLMSVQSMKNTYNLEFVEHKHAIECIVRACAESHKITLIVGHPTAYFVDRNLRTVGSLVQNPLTKTNQINEYQSTNNKQLQELPFERQVLLRRSPKGFGFSVISSDVIPGVFISFIQPEGPADKSNALRKGDRILSVNGIDLQNATHEHAGSILKECADTANLRVIYQYDDFLRSQNRREFQDTNLPNETSRNEVISMTPKRTEFFVRADFDYVPKSDPSLPSAPGIEFHIGDILHIINAADDNWWQARLVVDGQEKEIGIIPSKSRVEKKERTRQKRVNFNQGSRRINTSEHEKKKRKDMGLVSKSRDRKDMQSGEDSEYESENFEPVLSYQLVVPHQIDYARPVLILGSFRQHFVDQLISEHPDDFANCVPHTTRQRRDYEIDGQDYYFVSKRQQMEEDIQNQLFVEAGEYGGNLYGTSIKSIRDLAYQSKNCILTLTGNAIKRLIKAGLYPIVIFVRPRSVQWILDNMDSNANVDQAHSTFVKCKETEKKFGDLFTAIIEENSLQDVYHRLCEIIQRENRVDLAWIPSEENF